MDKEQGWVIRANLILAIPDGDWSVFPHIEAVLIN